MSVTRLPDAAEFDLVGLLRARCAIAREDVHLGIGDDAALLAVPAGQMLAVSTDTLVSGIHFPKDTKPFDIGWKALAVNLSDLAAMGATPAWASLALTLPRADRAWIAAFADGFAALAGEYKLALIGGDTTQGPLSITITVHGFVAENLALRRNAAKPGDAVFVTGTLGDAAAGLRCLDQNSAAAHPAQASGSSLRETLIARLHRPTPRIAQGIALRRRAHACIDVSDGLVADLGHICAASGVGAAIDLERLPASPALLRLFDADTRAGFQLAGGDDYELCFTAPEAGATDLLNDLARSNCGATRIGRIVSAAAGESATVRVLDAAGNAVQLEYGGWQHFRA
jgi:thiamine-monophosphate kinase